MNPNTATVTHLAAHALRDAATTSGEVSLRVAVDIDGVLYNLLDACRDWLHTTHGIALDAMPDPQHYNMWGEWNLNIGKTLAEVLTEAVQAGHMFRKGRPYPDGLAGLRALRAAGHHIVLISARDLPGIEDACREATEAWLESVGAVYDELHITSDKNSVDYDILIDDYEKNVRNSLAVGRRAILLKRGWNRHVNMAQYAWPDILPLVAGKFPLASNAP